MSPYNQHWHTCIDFEEPSTMYVHFDFFPSKLDIPMMCSQNNCLTHSLVLCLLPRGHPRLPERRLVSLLGLLIHINQRSHSFLRVHRKEGLLIPCPPASQRYTVVTYQLLCYGLDCLLSTFYIDMDNAFEYGQTVNRLIVCIFLNIFSVATATDQQNKQCSLLSDITCNIVYCTCGSYRQLQVFKPYRSISNMYIYVF